MAQIPSDEKAAFIALVQAAPAPGGYIEALRLQTILTTYDTIITAIIRQRDLFASNNAYLTQCMDVFSDDTELLNVGIWYNKTQSSPPISDPVVIINSTIQGDVFLNATSPPVFNQLTILGPTYVERIYLDSTVNLFQLYLGDGVLINQINSSNTGALINRVDLKNISNNPARVNYAIPGSAINGFFPDTKYFGGFSNDNPQATCGAEIADYKYDIITHNAISLTWTPPNLQSPPAQYLFINTYYRIKGNDTWILADEVAGLRNDDIGFTFNNLKTDTTYEFRTDVICNNGGISSTSILTIATTAVAQ